MLFFFGLLIAIIVISFTLLIAIIVVLFTLLIKIIGSLSLFSNIVY
ncbi:MAG: hypothetical protein Q8830_03785 [Candidatus Phytoplasma australasiaticum]|nr:hypothetical protein [Candidatus Phytoplasma australasiaticum]